MKLKKFLSDRIKFPHGRLRLKKKSKSESSHQAATEPATDVACSFTNCYATAYENHGVLPFELPGPPTESYDHHYESDKDQRCAVWVNDINCHCGDQSFHEVQDSATLTRAERVPSPPQRSRIRTNPWVATPGQSMPRPHTPRHATSSRQQPQSVRRPHSLQRQEKSCHQVGTRTPTPQTHTDWYHDDMSKTLPPRSFRRNLTVNSWEKPGVSADCVPIPPATSSACPKDSQQYEIDSAYSTLLNEQHTQTAEPSYHDVTNGNHVGHTSDMSRLMVDSARSQSQPSSISLSKSDPDSSPEHDSGLGEMDSPWGRYHTQQRDCDGMVSRCTQTHCNSEASTNAQFSSKALSVPRKRTRRSLRNEQERVLDQTNHNLDGRTETCQEWPMDRLTNRVQKLCLAKSNIESKIREAEIECDSIPSYQHTNSSPKSIDYSPVSDDSYDYSSSLLDTIGNLQSKIDDHCQTMKDMFPYLFSDTPILPEHWD